MNRTGKNRAETESAIFDAVTRIVAQKGFASLGVNAIAEEAGVSKVLIYRYFGGYRELLEDWASRRNFWVKSAQEAEKAILQSAGDRVAISSILKRLVRSQGRNLRSDPIAREILRWFIAEKDSAASAVMARVEARGTALSAAIESAIGAGRDSAALSAIAIGGLYYLALLSDRVSVFNGLEIASDADWERLLAAIETLIDLYVLS